MSTQTLRQACSDVLTSLKGYDLDTTLSFRYIKNILINKASLLFKQDSKLREFTLSSNLWVPIDCFELCEVPMSECLFYGCNSIMKSTRKIPDVVQTSFGYALKVMNLDLSGEFLPTTPQAYKDIKARQFKSKLGYYWVVDNYLFLPDTSIDTVYLLGMFLEGASIEDGKIVDCYKVLDSQIPFPDYILSLAKTETIKEVLGSNKQIRTDNNPNLNDAK